MKLADNDHLEIYRLLRMGRKLEVTLSEHPKLGGYHAATGEEGTIVGAFYGLRKSDIIVPHYRGAILSAYIHGADLRKLVAGTMGKETAYNRSRFRGDLCLPVDMNIIGLFTGILGSTLNFAVGAGLTFRLKGVDDVVVVTFGEGTSNLGAFHENINLAACLDLPVVFICQNNQYAISTNVSQSMKCRSVADRAIGYGIPGVSVDGNCVLDVHDAVSEAVSRARNGGGPTLIEALTFRMAGHFSADPAKYQSEEERNVWKQRDPLEQYYRWLREENLLSDQRSGEIDSHAAEEVALAIRVAEEDPEPDQRALGLDEVFAPASAGGAA